MKVKLLAFDSFGVRSMATYIETKDLRILVDPGVSLAPRRFGLPPHSQELKRMDECAKIIRKYSEASDILAVTHYHYDHHDLGETIPVDVYKGKVLYIKNPVENINLSQKLHRAPLFLKAIKDLPKKIEYAEGSHAEYGGTSLKFSKAVYHGTNPRLGYVVEVSVKEGSESVLHTSDVEGPSLPEQCEFILQKKPRILVVDGPMGYMLGYRYGEENLNASIKNLMDMIEKARVEIIVLDHHFLRDLNYKSQAEPLYRFAEKKKVKVCSAAEFSGRKIEMLEANRKELYMKDKVEGET